MPFFLLTIPLSAFLLFQVQPLIARSILPWFGGTPAVWTTCMLFFQVVLLAGYAYAHLLCRWSIRVQSAVHLTLLVSAVPFLPISPDAGWTPQGNEDPSWRILALLLLSIGVPYGLLSSTGPLLQRWFSQAYPLRSPYRLFALSNAGSLLALMTYPFLFEPNLSLQMQRQTWSIAFGVFLLLCGATTIWTRRAVGESTAEAADEESSTAGATAPGWSRVLLWLGLAALPSVMLLATTNQLCQEVAVVPFLWILPLSLYLLSFILCFDSDFWYRRNIFGVLLFASAGLSCICLYKGVAVALPIQILSYSTTLFAACMTCHGELARCKPDSRYLTGFYLTVAGGGALGGILVVLVAPQIFSYYWEYHWGLAGCVLITLVAWYRDQKAALYGGRPFWAWCVLTSLFAGLASVLYSQYSRLSQDTVDRSRDFYGVLTVTEGANDIGAYRSVRNGQIQHGFQFLDEKLARMRTSYYGTGTGVSIAVDDHPRRESGPLHLGVVGLGTGTMAVYGQSGDRLRFYEINPEVQRVAYEHFSYCEDCPAELTIELGDARVQMERALRDSGSLEFDVLAIDAFSSDAIPMHLMTRECFALYWKHLKEDGILAVHISNRFLNLRPLTHNLAVEAGYTPILVEWDPPDDAQAETSSTWVLVTRNAAFLERPDLKWKSSEWPEEMPETVWTDDYGSLWQVLKREDLTRGLHKFFTFD